MLQKRIVITASDAHFLSGYQSGYLAYLSQHEGKEITDNQILTIVSTALQDEIQTPRWSIGYVSGFFAGLYDKSYTLDQSDVQVIVKGEGYE